MRVNFEISTHWLDENQKSKVSSIADMFKHNYHCSFVDVSLFLKVFGSYKLLSFKFQQKTTMFVYKSEPSRTSSYIDLDFKMTIQEY